MLSLRRIYKTRTEAGNSLSTTACDRRQTLAPKAREQELYQIFPESSQTSRRDDLLPDSCLTSTAVSYISVVSLLLQTIDANRESMWKQQTTYSMWFQFNKAVGLPHPASLVLHDAHVGCGQTHIWGQEPHNHFWWGEPCNALQYNCCEEQ